MMMADVEKTSKGEKTKQSVHFRLDCGMDVDQFNSWHWNFLLVLKILADDKG
jgi:hypothetical protein